MLDDGPERLPVTFCLPVESWYSFLLEAESTPRDEIN
jgi:hypothetical protein